MFQLSEDQEAIAKKLHEECLVIDGTTLIHVATSERWFNQARSGGVDAIWVTTGGSAGISGTIRAAANVLRYIESHSDVAVQVRTTEEMRKAKKEGKLGILFATQNAACLDGDYAYLTVMDRLGYRVMGLTYSESNMLGDGCGERTRETRGLSYFGVDVVHEMNRLGMLVDLAHCGDATTMDAIKESTLPCLFTHANVRAISDSSRNKTDEQIQAMAESGGVMGITGLPRMVNNDLRAATIDGVLDHIDYVVDLVGVDHVGFAGDYTDSIEKVKLGEMLPGHGPANSASTVKASPTTGAGWAYWRIKQPGMLGTIQERDTVPYAKGLEGLSKLPNLTRGLVARGYDDDSIAKILGENWLSVLEKGGKNQ
jgi:membrane dipeptidase